eukprot:TRINITY_DN6571_c0_g2_i1.p1 TRINITY_DN6571_c0_g2~~TRINITY_DN6571_c0_g2_i1.p1  ORF type:complete len:400 (+),score=65.44 TRINITY_DN6571_c0_g2_i1:101-1300(+)
MITGLLLSTCTAACVLSTRARAVPEFRVNLDAAPEQRFVDVVQHFNVSLWDFYNSLKPHFMVDAFTKKLSRHRGPEPDEFQREIQGLAEISRIPLDDLHAIQMLYELDSLMVPVVNWTWPWDTGDALQSDFASMLQRTREWLPHFGCTGIVAVDSRDGTVYQGRNLDFAFSKHLQPLVYVAVFMKNGSELFRAQTMAGYPQIITGMRRGKDGYTMEANTRYPDHRGGNKELLKNLFSEKRILNGWSKRKIMETIDNYDDAVHAFSTTPFVATEYNIISGVKKGTVLAREPDGLAYQLPLNESAKGFVIMTNFDYIWHDMKEHFDPTSVAGFGSRRKAAEKILDSADAITPEVLSMALNDPRVLAKTTIFQAVMNVELGLWTVSLPACEDCGVNAGELIV